jgi:hypothetical protein
LNLVEDITARTSSTDGLLWDAGVNNGGLSIIDYRVNLGTDDGSFGMTINGVTDTSLTVQYLTLGITYVFTVEARNSVGFGP